MKILVINAGSSSLKYQFMDSDTGEVFAAWVIEGPQWIKNELPFEQAGLPIQVVDDVTPYKQRKVRILNGAHTANVPAAYLAGLSTVDEMMTHPVIGKFARAVIYDEIIPAVNLERGMLTAFADDVVNRFLEPSMHHQLASILMNCASKIRARVLPSILDARSRGMLPKKLCFALAAFFALYHKADGQIPVKVSRAGGLSGEFNDDAGAVAALSKAWSYYTGTEASAQLTVKAILADRSLWGQDLSSDVDLMQLTAKLTHAVISDGVLDTMRDLLEHP